MALGWILASCVLLSLYDVSKKASVSENAVFPVLFGSTLSGFAVVTATLALRGALTATVGVAPAAVALLLVKSCLVGASWTATYMALRTLPITTAAPIRATGPLWTFLGAVALFGELPTAAQAVGMALAFLGCLAFVIIPRTASPEPRTTSHEPRTPNHALLLAFVGTFFGSASALYDKCLLQQRGLATGTVLWWFLGGMCVIYGAAVALSRRATPRVPFQFRWTIPLVGVLLAASDACYFNAVSTPGAKISILSLVRRTSVVLTFLIGGAVFRESNLVRKGLALAAILAGVILLSVSAFGDVQVPTNWTGTVRTADGWLAFRMDAAADGAARFADDRAFVLSPRAEKPVRTVVIRAREGAFSLAPLVAGRERTARTDWTLLGKSGDEAVSSMTFAASEGVEAVRLWGTGDLLVIGVYGANEDATGLLAAPSEPTLAVTSLAADGLAAEVALPANAAGARLRLVRLEGVPRATAREDFANGQATWTTDCDNATLSSYASAAMTDTKTAHDGASLRIAKIEADGTVSASVFSPTFPAAVCAYSFAMKRTTGDSSDRVSVYGQVDGATDWARLDAGWPVETSMRWITNAVDSARNVRRLKFVFTASAATCRPAMLDSLCVTYGGDETRVETAEWSAADGRFATNGLATARYAVAARVLGADGMVSRWSAEQIVDLSWANLTAQPPTDIAAHVETTGVRVEWGAVEGAVAYRVTVTSADGATVCERETVETETDVGEIGATGEYAVRVASVLPDGRVSAASAPTAFTVAVGAVASVTVTAKGGERLVASWPAATFATAYRVTVAGVDGDERIVRTLTTSETSVTVAGLSSAGTYRVRVAAVGGPDGTWSAAVAMAATAPRRGEAVSLADVFVTGGTYREDFAALATDAADDALRHWQFSVGGVAARETRRASVSASAAAGVYAVVSSDGAAHLASKANGSDDVRLGLRFVNDTQGRVGALSLAFDAPEATKAFAVEWLVGDGAADLAADGEWRAVSAEGALEGAVLEPGQALVVRWRDDARTSSPVLILDNVALAFARDGENGLHVMLK